MNRFTLDQTATEVDDALRRVVSADTEPKVNSRNMVTSGGVKASIDSITTGDVINAASLGDSLDTVITSDATHLLIPTSKAVVDYVNSIF